MKRAKKTEAAVADAHDEFRITVDIEDSRLSAGANPGDEGGTCPHGLVGR